MMYTNDMIQDYLQQRTVVSLLPNADFADNSCKLSHNLSPDRFIKVGLLPFIRRSGLSYYVMKPRAEHKELGEPEFQICKGTRMYYAKDIGWQDIKEGQVVAEKTEELIETALREGREELGIDLQNIVGLFDMGAYDFSSASTGKTKQMWMFAAEVIDVNDFLADGEIAETTAKRAWLRAEEFLAIGRADHRPILSDIHARLSDRFKILI